MKHLNCIAGVGTLCLLVSGVVHADLYGTEIKDAPAHVVSGIRVVAKEPVTVPTPAPAMPEMVMESFTLNKGESVKDELERWAHRSGWVIDWQLSNSWIVPNGITFQGDFKSAASAVIETLAENGIVIRAITNDANKTMLVLGASVREQ